MVYNIARRSVHNHLTLLLPDLCKRIIDRSFEMLGRCFILGKRGQTDWLIDFVLKQALCLRLELFSANNVDSAPKPAIVSLLGLIIAKEIVPLILGVLKTCQPMIVSQYGSVCGHAKRTLFARS